jgi:hypothetical protein
MDREIYEEKPHAIEGLGLDFRGERRGAEVQGDLICRGKALSKSRIIGLTHNVKPRVQNAKSAV